MSDFTARINTAKARIGNQKKITRVRHKKDKRLEKAG